MKKHILIFGIIFSFILIASVVSFADTEERGLGAIYQQEPYKQDDTVSMPSDPIILPSSVNLATSIYFPPVGDQ